ncbi:uncharacterized protein LOC112432677 isoform X1 [Maylandia zebra]|uniref:uncharacterized protein LOC112432677 isoform X1 n=1 Tax=Maylandia zebra TaxID=106582 RepID=UPI00403D4592
MMHFLSPCTGPFMTGTGTTERQPHTSKLHRAHAAPRRINDVPGPRPKPSHPLPPRRLLLGPSRTTHQPLYTLKPCVDQEISRTGTTERQRQTSKLHRAHAAPRRINDVPDPQLKPSHPLPPRRLLLGPSRTTHQPLYTLKPCVDQEISRTGTTERQRQTSKLHRAHAAPRRINDVPDPQLKPSHPLPPRRLLPGPSRTTHQPLYTLKPCVDQEISRTGTTERQRQTSKLHRAHAAPRRINDVPDPQLKPSHPLPPRRLLPGPSRTTHQPLYTLKPCVDQEISRTGTTERQRQTSKLHRAHAAPRRINDVPDPQLKPSHPLPPRRLLPGPSRTTHQPLYTLKPCVDQEISRTGTTERQRQTSKLHRAHAAPRRINDVPDPQLKPSHPLPPRRLLPGPSRTTHQPLYTLKPCVDQEISRTGTTERQRQTSKLHRAHAAPRRINDVPDPQLKPSHPLPPRRLLPGPSRTTHQPLGLL